MAAPTVGLNTINVREFLSKWDNDVYLSCAENTKSDTDTLTKKLKMSVENVKELENVCSLDLLVPESDTNEAIRNNWDYLENIPSNSKLMCVRFQKQELERRRRDPLYYISVMRKHKHKKYDDLLIYNPELKSNKEMVIPEDCRVIYPDVLLTVQIHDSAKVKFSKRKMEQGKPVQSKIANTLLVLGRQKLTDLRDVIRCVYDLTLPGDVSENPDIEGQVYAKDVFKSGFFFINDVFYNDMREPDNRDYSLEIREWSSEPPRNIKYKTQLMEDTTFLDLTLKLGTPYLYMHQGDCQHVLIFSDIRLLTTEDPQDVRMYPYMTSRVNKQRTICRVCCAQAARWITHGSEFTPENPCFLCDICFRSLNYDSDNKKIGNFEAYRYFDKHAIL